MARSDTPDSDNHDRCPPRPDAFRLPRRQMLSSPVVDHAGLTGEREEPKDGLPSIQDRTGAGEYGGECD